MQVSGLDLNADFAPIFSNERYLVIKRWDTTAKTVILYPPSLGPQPQRQTGANADAYDSAKISVRNVPARILATNRDMVEIGLDDQPLVARTEFKTEDGWKVVLEYPAKTINLNERDMLYQPDTGPLIWLETPGVFEHPEQGFRLAFIAFHQPDWAEVLINVPTQAAENVNVHHYSLTKRIECHNLMLQLL